MAVKSCPEIEGATQATPVLAVLLDCYWMLGIVPMPSAFVRQAARTPAPDALSEPSEYDLNRRMIQDSIRNPGQDALFRREKLRYPMRNLSERKGP